MKSVSDNVAIHAIECCLIAGTSDLLSPSHVLQMDQELVRGIAAESHQNQALREQTQRKMVVLQAGLDICRVHANRKSLSAPFHSVFQIQSLLISSSDRTEISKSRFVGSRRPMKRPDPEQFETSFDAEQLHQVSCTDRRSMIAVTDRPPQETVENASAGLPESITISSALEIVPPPDDVELSNGSRATEPGQAAPFFSFNTASTAISYPTGGSSSPVSTKAKKSKKDTKP